jgi:hypothetical protein
VRPVLECIERGHTLVETRALSTMQVDAVEALRRAGILRPLDEHVEEISVPDLVRALRVLYEVEGRGLQTPTEFGPVPMMLGWAKGPAGDREVVLVVPTTSGLFNVLVRKRPTLALVPTARDVAAAGRSGWIGNPEITIEVLEDALAVREGHLVRAGIAAPDAPSLERPPALAALPARPLAKPAPIAKLERWNELRVCLVNQRTVRVDVPGRKVRCTSVDLGMVHPRTREPTLAWEMLVTFCEKHGQFTGTRFGTPDATKKVISRLGKELRALFGLSQSPFYPYRTSAGWKTRFDARSSVPTDDFEP